jgi:hypothetical protein
MLTSRQKIFLSLLGLLTLAAVDVQAQSAAAKSQPLMTLVNKSYDRRV